MLLCVGCWANILRMSPLGPLVKSAPAAPQAVITTSPTTTQARGPLCGCAVLGTVAGQRSQRPCEPSSWRPREAENPPWGRGLGAQREPGFPPTSPSPSREAACRSRLSPVLGK